MSEAQAAKRVLVVEKILSANDQVAAENRQRLTRHGVTTINIMSSPGSGKTTLLLATIDALRGRARIGVIEGDVASQVDADKIAAAGTPVVQINTGGGCHLDAAMVRQALDRLPLAEMDLLFIENVGNLICPVGFDLGQRYHVGLLSVPEGHDKPYKYPTIFEAVDLVLVTKLDLLPYLDFDLEAFQHLVRGMNARAPILPLSARTKQGFDAWITWLEGAVKAGQAGS